MAKCDVCGNDYDKTFQITSAGKTGTFDSFECAIHAFAPVCPHCRCKIVGHGVEVNNVIYCCAHCAKHSGASGVRDRA
jgi:phage terminase large subunit GpA-like protein